MSNLSGSGTLRGALSRGGGTPSDVYWDDILDKPEFAEVATSGSYNDLTDKPTIPLYTAGEGIDIINNVISATGGGGGSANIYNVLGDIMGSVNNNVNGYGNAVITVIDNIVRIDFACKLGAQGGASEQWGISKTKIMALDSNIPNFTPIQGGWWDLYDYDSNHMQYAPVCNPSINEELYTFARIYDISTTPPDVGDWGANTWSVGTPFKGVCFGIIEEVNNE